MGLLSFIKEAGEKLFGKGEAKAAQDAAAAAPTPENIAALSKSAGDAIASYIVAQNLKVDGLAVAFDAPSATVTVSGTVAAVVGALPDQPLGTKDVQRAMNAERGLRRRPVLR